MDDSWRRNRFSAMTAIPSHPERAIPFCILLSYDSPSSPASRASVFCGQCGQSHVHPRLVFQVREADRDHAEIYARFRPVGYDNGVSLSRFLCCRSYRKQFAHNTIHDFMISRWQNSVIPQSIFNVWHNSEKQSVFCRDYGFPIGNHCITQSQFQSDNMAIDWIRLKAIHYSFNALHFSFRISVIIVFLQYSVLFTISSVPIHVILWLIINLMNIFNIIQV